MLRAVNGRQESCLHLRRQHGHSPETLTLDLQVEKSHGSCIAIRVFGHTASDPTLGWSASQPWMIMAACLAAKETREE